MEYTTKFMHYNKPTMTMKLVVLDGYARLDFDRDEGFSQYNIHYISNSLEMLISAVRGIWVDNRNYPKDKVWWKCWFDEIILELIQKEKLYLTM